MNRSRKIVVVSVLAIVALAVTTGWSIMASSADWPPAPYQVSSLAGTWYNVAGGDPMTILPEDPQTGRGGYLQTNVTPDVTAGGAMPTAKNWTPWFGAYARTGSNTWQHKRVCYTRDGANPANILCIAVMEGTITMTGPDTMDLTRTNSIYLSTQDKDGDRLPDPGEKPVLAIPATTEHYKRL